jgi:hypothetical protein
MRSTIDAFQLYLSRCVLASFSIISSTWSCVSGFTAVQGVADPTDTVLPAAPRCPKIADTISPKMLILAQV